MKIKAASFQKKRENDKAAADTIVINSIDLLSISSDNVISPTLGNESYAKAPESFNSIL